MAKNRAKGRHPRQQGPLPGIIGIKPSEILQRPQIEGAQIVQRVLEAHYGFPFEPRALLLPSTSASGDLARSILTLRLTH